MSKFQIPPFLVYSCPIGHDEKCPRKWSNRYIDHHILCLCKCHKGLEDLK